MKNYIYKALDSLPDLAGMTFLLQLISVALEILQVPDRAICNKAR
jgi:hypothetical protein